MPIDLPGPSSILHQLPYHTSAKTHLNKRRVRAVACNRLLLGGEGIEAQEPATGEPMPVVLVIRDKSFLSYVAESFGYGERSRYGPPGLNP